MTTRTTVALLCLVAACAFALGQLSAGRDAPPREGTNATTHLMPIETDEAPVSTPVASAPCDEVAALMYRMFHALSATALDGAGIDESELQAAIDANRETLRRYVAALGVVDTDAELDALIDELYQVPPRPLESPGPC